LSDSAKNHTAPNIYQRMLAVMGEVESVQKADKMVNGQYRYVTHDAVTAALHKPCVKHGIFVATHLEDFKQDGNRSEAMLAVTFINADQPEDRFTVRSVGFGIDKSDKGPGKATSYALKIALLKQFLLEAGEADNEAADIPHTPSEASSVGQASTGGGGHQAAGSSSTSASSPSPPLSEWDGSEVIPGGKHQGEKWAGVNEDYLEWCATKSTNPEVKKKAQAEQWRRKINPEPKPGPKPPVIDDDDDLPFVTMWSEK